MEFKHFFRWNVHFWTGHGTALEGRGNPSFTLGTIISFRYNSRLFTICIYPRYWMQWRMKTAFSELLSWSKVFCSYNIKKQTNYYLVFVWAVKKKKKKVTPRVSITYMRLGVQALNAGCLFLFVCRSLILCNPARKTEKYSERALLLHGRRVCLWKVSNWHAVLSWINMYWQFRAES